MSKVFVYIAFLKNRRENKGKMNLVQPAGCFESSPSVSGGHQVDGLPPARSQQFTGTAVPYFLWSVGVQTLISLDPVVRF